MVKLISQNHDDIMKAWWACRDCGTPFAPAGSFAVAKTDNNTAPHQSVDQHASQEYVSIRELSRLIGYAEGTIRNLMSEGEFRLGVHYMKPRGRILFKTSAVRAWIEADAKSI
jgi:predicted DNA-binding transcriptional regulator AlpA